MNLQRLAIIAILIFIAVIGCSGRNGQLINQSQADSKVTQKELMDNWLDYHIMYRNNANVIVFDPKNDGRKIVAGGSAGGIWVKVQDPEGWGASPFSGRDAPSR